MRKACIDEEVKVKGRAGTMKNAWRTGGKGKEAKQQP